MITYEGTFHERSTWMRAGTSQLSQDMGRRPDRGPSAQQKDSFLTHGQKQHGEKGNFSFAPLEETLTWQGCIHPQEEVRMQDLVSHNMTLCGAETGESSTRKSACSGSSVCFRCVCCPARMFFTCLRLCPFFVGWCHVSHVGFPYVRHLAGISPSSYDFSVFHWKVRTCTSP